MLIILDPWHFIFFESTNSTIVNQYAGFCVHYEELIIRYSSQCPQVTTVKFITRKPLSAEIITNGSKRIFLQANIAFYN